MCFCYYNMKNKCEIEDMCLSEMKDLKRTAAYLRSDNRIINADSLEVL